ncbi:MAG: hypothetical protein KAR06_01830 [Deltaproteobacteria bacterium]|nr:hypothetical protein [Deltaproteobacteria bacterium]
MRDLAADKNECRVIDARSASKITLYYRNPTTEEHVKYRTGQMTKKGNRIINTSFQQKVKSGLAILTGFKEGGFGHGGKLIASDSASENFREDWKKLIKDMAPDIIATFAYAIFEGVAPDYSPPEEESGEEYVSVDDLDEEDDKVSDDELGSGSKEASKEEVPLAKS